MPSIKECRAIGVQTLQTESARHASHLPLALIALAVRVSQDAITLLQVTFVCAFRVGLCLCAHYVCLHCIILRPRLLMHGRVKNMCAYLCLCICVYMCVHWCSSFFHMHVCVSLHSGCRKGTGACLHVADPVALVLVAVRENVDTTGACHTIIGSIGHLTSQPIQHIN